MLPNLFILFIYSVIIVANNGNLAKLGKGNGQ